MSIQLRVWHTLSHLWTAIGPHLVLQQLLSSIPKELSCTSQWARGGSEWGRWRWYSCGVSSIDGFTSYWKMTCFIAFSGLLGLWLGSQVRLHTGEHCSKIGLKALSDRLGAMWEVDIQRKNWDFSFQIKSKTQYGDATLDGQQERTEKVQHCRLVFIVKVRNRVQERNWLVRGAGHRRARESEGLLRNDGKILWSHTLYRGKGSEGHKRASQQNPLILEPASCYWMRFEFYTMAGNLKINLSSSQCIRNSALKAVLLAGYCGNITRRENRLQSPSPLAFPQPFILPWLLAHGGVGKGCFHPAGVRRENSHRTKSNRITISDSLPAVNLASCCLLEEKNKKASV